MQGQALLRSGNLHPNVREYAVQRECEVRLRILDRMRLRSTTLAGHRDIVDGNEPCRNIFNASRQIIFPDEDAVVVFHLDRPLEVPGKPPPHGSAMRRFVP